MEKKYIIELPENTYWIQWIMKGTKDGHPYMDFKDVEDLTPYTKPDTEAIEEEAYQRGLDDAWEAAKKNYLPEDHGGLGYKTRRKVFDTDDIGWIFKNLSASEAIEKIRQYEQKKEEQKEEKPILVEDVMRQYLNIFCDQHRCSDDKCPLHTPEFTCGRGKHFLSPPHERVSDEEVRRAYAKAMKGNNND